MTWRATVLTLFPELYPGPLGFSLAGKALQQGLWQLDTVNIRDYAQNKHDQVDDECFGGGAGMVLRPDVVDRAIQAAVDCHEKRPRLIYFSPRGRLLRQEMAWQMSQEPVVMLCGRYEGVDQRVLEDWQMEEVSLGDYILSSGDMASFIFMDACVRLIPGVVGKEESLKNESFELDLLEHSHYTRPRVWKGREVPDVLLSGHHSKIEAWRKAESEKITQERRPDLWSIYCEKRLRAKE